MRRWEPRSFSDRIEAAVGADLQYMRMNAMVVGGALYLLGALLMVWNIWKTLGASERAAPAPSLTLAAAE